MNDLSRRCSRLLLMTTFFDLISIVNKDFRLMTLISIKRRILRSEFS